MVSNPFAYIVYRKRRLEYQKAMELARTHREAFLKYGVSNRVIEAAGIRLDRKSYYNIKVNYITSKQVDGLKGILDAFKN
jgi:hypothetical protein